MTRIGTPLVRAALPDDDGGIVGVASGGPVPVVIRGQRWATPEEVAASFAAASGELDVPLAYTVLRRSLVEFHTGDYRLCVIDACSAAEIALAAALTVHLRAHGLTDTQIQQFLRLGSGIAEALPVYRQFVPAGQSAVSRNRVIAQLAEPRNRAVHAGEHPPEAVAERALETGARLVGEAVPLPRPDNIPLLARAMARLR